MVVVPLYDTLGPGAIRYIVNTGKDKIDVLSEITLWLGMVHFPWLSTSWASLLIVLESLREVPGELCVPMTGLRFQCAQSRTVVDGTALAVGSTPQPPTPVLPVVPHRFFSPHGEQF